MPGDRGSAASAIDFQSYDAIPVKRRGAGESEEEVPSMQSFDELRSVMPAWAADNLLDSKRMRYRLPTPIQKHTVPLALRGHGPELRVLALGAARRAVEPRPPEPKATAE